MVVSAPFLATISFPTMSIRYALTLAASVFLMAGTLPQALAAVEAADTISDIRSTATEPSTLSFLEVLDTPSAPSFLEALDTGIALLPVPEDTIWLHIDLRSRQLDVVRGEEIIKTIPHFAIGVNGAESLRVRGSSITPTGEFRIERINPYSQFHTFLGINYPNPSVADQALSQGLITEAEAQRIQRYYSRHRLSYPNTSLGGHIGIHGLGQRDPFLHQRTDWTEGCVAVENDQIRSLSRLVTVDTPVLIH